jgi:hypothetical protein
VSAHCLFRRPSLTVIHTVSPPSLPSDMVDNDSTAQWLALKRSSHFYDPSGIVLSQPIADGVLRVDDSMTMSSNSSSHHATIGILN